MNYHGMTRNSSRHTKNFYQIVTSPILMIDMNIQDGGKHNNFVLNKAKMILKICKRF